MHKFVMLHFLQECSEDPCVYLSPRVLGGPEHSGNVKGLSVSASVWAWVLKMCASPTAQQSAQLLDAMSDYYLILQLLGWGMLSSGFKVDLVASS